MKKVCGLVLLSIATGGLFTRISWDNNDWWDRGKPLGNGATQTKTPEKRQYDKLANYLQKELGVSGLCRSMTMQQQLLPLR